MTLLARQDNPHQTITIAGHYEWRLVAQFLTMSTVSSVVFASRCRASATAHRMVRAVVLPQHLKTPPAHGFSAARRSFEQRQRRRHVLLVLTWQHLPVAAWLGVYL
ncbi:hypothetical protein ACVOMT_09510 [Sphingomonas panni]